MFVTIFLRFFNVAFEVGEDVSSVEIGDLESGEVEGGDGGIEGDDGTAVDLAGRDGAGPGDEEGDADAAFGEHAFFAVHRIVE